MAPSLVTIGGIAKPSVNKTAIGPYKEFDRGYFNASAETNGTDDGHGPAKYPHYLPTWKLTGPNSDGTYPPLEPFDHIDIGHTADPAFPTLLGPTVARSNITPHFGSELTGVQLSSLTAAGRAELALFVAQRGVVAFRDQDFADLPISDALAFARNFGRLHIHPASGQPEGFPEVHLVHRGANDPTPNQIYETRTSSVVWHSDVTYEQQPPGTTFLYPLETPSDADGVVSGGDTAFVSQILAYERLSEPFKKRLEGLKATHSGVEQANAARGRGGIVRREPVVNTHPVVRTHPVTRKKALFVQPQFTRNIVGYKQEESDYLLKFLYDHIAYGVDFQIRVKWAPRTVVVWDNRVTAHSALLDWSTGGRRHLARITPQAERPRE